MAFLASVVALVVVSTRAPAVHASTFSCGSHGVAAGTDAAGSCTYTTKGADSFTPPTGVTQATFDVYGAQGGGSGGGPGGEATAILSLTGASVQVTVGGMGGFTNSGVSSPVIGGTNGGGNGGGTNGITGYFGYGGGGASDVRTGGCAPFCNLSQRALVAGGGGGTGGSPGSDGGGTGGDLTGGAGDGVVTCAFCIPHETYDAGIGGGGGTQSTAGAGGTSGISGCSSGSAGDSLTLGTGGAGGIAAFFCNGSAAPGGGGGGGGWHGGGGGGNFATYAWGGGGGGGSGYGPAGTTFHAGVQSGNGKIVVSWPTDSVPPVVTISTSGVQAPTGWYNAVSSGSSGIRVSVSAADDATGVSNITCTDGATTVLNTSLSSDSFTLTDGMHSISCSATDGAANTGASSGSTTMPVTYNVDQTPPSLTFATATTATDGYLTGGSFTTFPATVGAQPIGASGSVSDPTSGVSSVSVNGVAASGSWAASGVPLSNGANTVTASATDVAGNTATVSRSVTLNPDLDGDGIRNNVDQSPQTASLGFSDTQLGGTTTGTIGTLPTGATVGIADSANPVLGVDATVTTISGGDRVPFQLNGKSGTVKCPTGSAAAGTTVCTITDPGITVDVLQGGPAEIDEIINGQTVAITIPVDSSVEVLETTNGLGQVTDITLENVTNGGSGTVTVNGVPVSSGSTLKIGTLQATLSVKKGIFNLTGTITPSPTSNGLDPRNEQVVLKLGGYTFTIPAHSFTLQKDGAYAYAGAIGGVSLNVRLKPMSGGRWSVGAFGQRVSGLTNPVNVVVQVGDDVATASVVAALT